MVKEGFAKGVCMCVFRERERERYEVSSMHDIDNWKYEVSSHHRAILAMGSLQIVMKGDLAK